jgi:threonyl-tRNA synthetase
MSVIEARDVSITLPDGSVRTYPAPVTGLQVAESIGARLAAAALAVKIDGVLADLSLPISHDAKLQIVTRESEEALGLIRHDAAHVMAEAVQSLFPGTQVTIGPAIENGFYYDFARAEPFALEDLEKIEAKMREIVQRNAAFTREVWPRQQAIDFFTAKGEKYKAEIIRDLPESETITVYRQGEWLDLCKGPHSASTGSVGQAFKLMKLAGAYWRGDSKNAMLQRIYGTAWRNPKELEAHLHQLEEAEKRDHRKLGKEMEIFTFAPEDIGVGLPLWLPNGTIIRNELEFLAQVEERRDGYHRVTTPILAKEDLYLRSGHLPYYAEDMYQPLDIEGEKYYLRPMNCPHHHHVYSSKPRVYHELPYRIAEYGNVFRYEASGGLNGILRTRGFCQNDAHIYCRFDQAKDEFIRVMHLHARYYKLFGIENFYMRLSLPDMSNLEKYVDQPDKWLEAVNITRQAMQESGYEYKEVEGEAAFYGPKVDFMIRSAIGTEYAISTNQLDFLATERFELGYKGSDGSDDHPVYVIHRAPLGSHERFVAFLLEHFAGKFPPWLAPVQMRVIPIAERHNEYANEIVTMFNAVPVQNGSHGLRVEADLSNERMQKKVRNGQIAKIPYLLVVGDKEQEGRTGSLRLRSGEDQGAITLDDMLQRLVRESETRELVDIDRAETAKE